MSNNFVREGNLSGDAVLDGVAQKVFFESVKIGTGSPSAAPSPASKVWLYADRSQNPAIMWLWDPSTATWHITGDGTGTGAVDSVNGQTGIVVLDHTDVGAEEAGAVADLAATLATVATSGDYDDLINKPTIPDISNLVEDTDPRLSDARTPLGHTHGIDDITTAELSTSKVLQPDGSGGVAWGTVSGPFTLKVPTGRYLSPAMQPYFEHPWVARVAFVGVAVGREQAWDGMGLVVKSAGSAATVDFGLYSDSGGYPGSLLASSVGVPISASADKGVFGAFAGGSVTIPVGYYWMATLIHDPDNNCVLTVTDNSTARFSDANLYMSALPPYSVIQTLEQGGYRGSSPAASLPATAPSGMSLGRYIPLPGLRAA